MKNESKIIREVCRKDISLTKKLKHLLVIILIGVGFGLFAKYADTVPDNIIPGLSDIGTYFGLWIFVITIIAAWSRSPKTAAIHSLAFLLSMLTTYYVYSAVLFGSIAIMYFIKWSLIALLSQAVAFILWYSRGKGIIAAICAALPIGLILVEGFSLIYILPLHIVQFGFDILAAIVLFIILPQNQTKQRICVLLFSGIIFVLSKFF